MPKKKSRAVSRAAAEAAVQTLLRWAGDDPAREGLSATPRRVVNAYQDWFSGYAEDPGAYLRRTFEEVEGYDEMVVLRDIAFESFCEHHMAPIIGRAHVGYLPSDRVVGISKLARVVDGFARRFQVQEKLTAQIAGCINDVLKPRGVGVVIDAVHQCMTTRGVHKRGVSMVTSKMLGAFRGECQHPGGVPALHRHRGRRTLISFALWVVVGGTLWVPGGAFWVLGGTFGVVRTGINSTEKLYWCFSPGCNAPTPTTLRAIFSPWALVIDTTTQYSHCSPCPA